jgi:hypothetical protein
MPAKKPIDLIDQLRGELYRTGYRGYQNRAKEWLLDKAEKLIAFNPKNRHELLKLPNRQQVGVHPGEMIFFVYDAKWKDKLPFFDRFPLVFPVEMYANGFAGLNLHYLPNRERLLFLNQLRKHRNNEFMDKTTKLVISYQTVKNASRLFQQRGFTCWHRYLWDHVRSSFITIQADEWDLASILPTEHWYQNPKAKL